LLTTQPYGTGIAALVKIAADSTLEDDVVLEDCAEEELAGNFVSDEED